MANAERVRAVVGSACALLLVTCSTTTPPPAAHGGTTISGPPATTTAISTSTVSTTDPPMPPSVPTSTSTPTTPTNATSTSTTSPTTSTPPASAQTLDGIGFTTIPADVIAPTSAATLDPATNPINGRRGAVRPLPTDLCEPRTVDASCLAEQLDLLGFDVTSGAAGDRARQLQRATAVVQLDADLPATGVADNALLDYLTWGEATRAADEELTIGVSQQGRPINARRYGDGAKVVLVVGQTHGDEEGGLRVLLRAATFDVPDYVTLWVVPTMNPDGGSADTRFLADGSDPNRRAPTTPEQLAVFDFAMQVRPELTVWYHQNYDWIGGSGASMSPAQRYQVAAGIDTLNRSGNCARGFMWCPIDDALGSSSILVELPDVMTPADVHTHAAALMKVAAES